MYVIGRGRYAREVYPKSPAAGTSPLNGTQYTFVVDPTAAVGRNVFNTLAAAAAARRLVNGPAIIEFRGDQAVQAVAYDLRDAAGEWNTKLQGAQGLTTVTFPNGATIVGATTTDTISITYSGAGTLCTLPASGVQFFRFLNGDFESTGGGTMFLVPAGGTGIFECSGFWTDGGGTVFASSGAAIMSITMEDGASIVANTIVSAGATFFRVAMISPASQVALAQAGVTGGVLVWGLTLLAVFSEIGNSNLAFTDASSTVAPTPANQTTPGALTDVLAAIVTPRVSGIFRVSANLRMAATATNTLICTVTTRTKTAAIVVANGTATGIGCFFATANGAITYGGGMTSSTKITKTLTVPAAPVTWEFSWSNTVAQGGAQTGFPVPTSANANNVAIAITVQDAANDVTGMTGSISVEEKLVG